VSVVFRRALPADFPEVRRITREAYLRAGHFAADHPYVSVLEDVEHRAEHAQVWVAETAGRVVGAVTLTFASQPYSEVATHGELEFRMLAVDPACQGNGLGRAVVREIVEHARQLPGIDAISITSATFMDRAHNLYESLGFRRAPDRDWYVPGEDVLLWVFTLEVSSPVLGVSSDQHSPRYVHDPSEVLQLRREHRLQHVMLALQDLLADDSSSGRHLLVLTDAGGEILSRVGSRQALRRADRPEFSKGADWSEAGIGTNAISEALLVTGGPVQLFSSEHLVRPPQLGLHGSAHHGPN